MRAPPPGCSKEEEACKTAADCCDVAAGYLCINDALHQADTAVSADAVMEGLAAEP